MCLRYFSTLKARWVSITWVTVAGAIWLYLRGPLPVMSGNTPLPGYVPAWYMLSAFPILGMLVADWSYLFAKSGFGWPTLELGCQIGLLVGLSILRLHSGILISGHALLFAYFIIRRVLVPFPSLPIRQVELLIAFGLFCLTSYVKLFWWSDPITLLQSIVIGGFLAIASHVILRLKFERDNRSRFNNSLKV